VRPALCVLLIPRPGRGRPIIVLRGLFTEERGAVAPAMVVVGAFSNAEADQQAIPANLDVGHARLRATHAGIGPDDRLCFYQTDLAYPDGESLRQVLFRLYHQILSRQVG
jgi:hypothetical protein